MLVVAFIGYNVYWNQRTQNRWDKVTNETRGAFNEIKNLVVKYPPDRVYRFINFPPRQHFGAKFFKLFFEPYDMASGIWPMEVPSYIDRDKILFLLQMNGHIYNDPEVAKKAVSTPWEHFYVAQFYLLIGDNQNGISELDKSTASVSDEKIHYFAAVTYRKLGLSSKAIEELKKVIQINEYSKYAIDTYKLLSFLSFKTGDLDSAIKYLEKAVYLNNKDVDAMGNLAQLYEDKGEVDKAKEIRKRASIGH
ncbi:MAG: tetratricopeptide repeat protein [Deltaproteobacteria bacterium]|nr:tetratricopeptide repeat protein [Deltaproteobacteria bacterium]